MGEAKRRRAEGAAPRSVRKRFRRRVVGVAVSVLAVAGLGGLYYLLTTPGVSPVDDLPRAPAGAEPFPEALDRFGVSVGDADAPVVVREFADYQCEACARLAPTMERFREDYVETGDARLVFFDFPLELHHNAVPAAMAARCAGDQDAYWAMQGRLFEAQSAWADVEDPAPRFLDYAGALGLDTALFRRCLATNHHRAAVERSRQAAAQVRVRRTPTVYVDNVELTRPGWYQLSGVVERRLKGQRGDAGD